ncbi:uncharacterized protein DUF1631 [Halospina denitrificans]|uniref:Uncharacterized protein DUF1631 n=1 Tax=Halospina denitrificans TaxID=332522 RepID=A0A4R7JKH3_9GAMM|nr:DUF1631 domain-containing protein [Halospina denitrificans]TDT38482.1 uncharacterized protein DUF1631 [Halospina denitrificans]
MSEQPGIHSVSSTLGAQADNRLPREIRQVWETVAPGLADLLGSALDAIDDSLFELANGARSNNDQNRYFETMREVRIKRKGIEKQFQEGLANLFRHPPASDISRRHEKPPQPVSAHSLSLVDNDDLEEQVAINAMTNKAVVSFQGTLLPLQTRLTSLYPGHNKDSPVNPLAPEPLSNLFREACSDLDIQIRERLILLKHFDRYVLASLGLVLDEANRILIQAGVVPNFHYEARKSEQVTESQTRRNKEKESAADAASGKEFLESIGALLSGYRRHSPHASGDTSGPDSFYIVSKKELYDLLSQMPQPQAESDLTQGRPERPDLREMISDLLARQPTTEGRTAALESMDEDLINLVALLFEFILDDHNLSPPVQVLISRLQIPILKVVVKDRSFFSKPSHPARKLLNALARAGIGWSNHGEKNRDRLYDEIHRVVHRIIEEFNGDVTLFETLYDEFETFLSRENRKATLVEQRTRESERGRIKSRKAQETVDQVLKERLENRQVPDSVRELLVNGWSRVMFLAYLRDDAEHRWAQTVRVVDDLLWCLRPHPESQDREQWVRLVPALIKSVRAGLEEVSYNANRLDSTMAELKKELTDSFRRQALAEAAEDSLTAEETPEVVPQAPSSTAVEREQALEDAAMAEHYETLEGIQVGDWVEFRLVNGTCFRCKLSAVIEEADSFVFVNRMGLKVVEKSRNELAHELRRERLMVLEQGALVDRALDAVVGGLTRKAG